MSILEYIVSFYNYEIIHGYLNYLSPMTFEKCTRNREFLAYLKAKNNIPGSKFYKFIDLIYRVRNLDIGPHRIHSVKWSQIFTNTWMILQQ